eukprot:1159131-Pelagomonas_calceolata.AAC.8
MQGLHLHAHALRHSLMFTHTHTHTYTHAYTHICACRGELGDGTACLTTTHSLPGRPPGPCGSGTCLGGSSNSSSSSSSCSKSVDGSSDGESSSSDGGVRWGAKGGTKWKKKKGKKMDEGNSKEGVEGNAKGSRERRKRRADPAKGALWLRRWCAQTFCVVWKRWDCDMCRFLGHRCDALCAGNVLISLLLL